MIKNLKNLNLDEIISIEDMGELDTYDFTIPETHCFFANDILVHNSGSIEENADLVLLLYYPYHCGETGQEYYKEGNNKYEFEQLNDESQSIVWSKYFEISISKSKNSATKLHIPVEYWGEYYQFKNWTSPNKIVEKYYKEQSI